MNRRVPIIAELILKLFLRSGLRQERLNDYKEIFNHIAQDESIANARYWYWGQTLRSIPILFYNSLYWWITMFKNYLKTALRTIINNKIYSIINISGIAISIAACFLILQYVAFELSYDQQHINKDNLYRLTNDRFQNGELKQHGVITYPSVAKTMQADYPEIENYTRARYNNRMYVRYENKGFDQAILFADSAFFNMFSFKLIQGNAYTVLGRPYSIALSETTAEKYFGINWRNENIIGKSLSIDDQFEVTVRGVFENVPTNSHMEFDIVVSYLTLRNQYGKYFDDSWTNSNFMSYLQLIPGADPKALEQKFIDFSERYFKGDEVTGYVEEFYLQPLTDIHLYSDYEYETWVHGNGTTVSALLLIACFILIITWVNYINLSTAKSIERAKEVGMRKIVGAHRSQITKQFMVESLFYNFFGLIIAIAIVVFTKPLFSDILAVQFSTYMLFNYIGIGFVIIFLAGTLFSGFYPAIVTSSFKTISVLKGRISNKGKGGLLRKGLVVFQFALSFALIAGTYVVYMQIDYMLNKDLGMNIEQTLVLESPRLVSWDSTFIEKVNSFKSELRGYPAVVNAATARRLPGSRTGRIFNIEKLSDNSDHKFTTSDVGIDYNFFDTFNMKIIAGRDFDISDHNTDFALLNSVIINKSAVKEFGFATPEEALQQSIRFWRKDWEIIGVVNDHHHQSLHVPLEPIIFTPQYSTRSYTFVKLKTNNISAAISTAEEVYNKFFPGNSFNYFFLDEYFDQQYESDQDFGNAFTLFASLGILLSCMGLFGLSFFITAQRTKEIGIRKVSGATTQQILGMLLKDFGKLVLISAFVASPLAYYVISGWLNTYSYRIDFGLTMLLIPAMLVFAVALLTISYQSIKAALANPIDSIKYE